MLITAVLPQDLRTTASPTFVGATFSGLTASEMVGTTAGSALVSVPIIGNGLTLSGGNLYWAWLGINDLSESPAEDSMMVWSGASAAVLWESGATLRTTLGIGTGDSPTLTGLTLSSLTSDRIISSVSGVLTSLDLDDWVAGTTNQITVTDDTDGSITLSTPQDIHTGASPTFANLTDSGLTVGRVTYAGAAGLLVDSANLTFDGTNLTCAGVVQAEQLTSTDDLTVTDTALIDGTLTLGSGTISDTTGAISFGDENLQTTGDITCDELNITAPTNTDYKLTTFGTHLCLLATTAGQQCQLGMFTTDGDGTDGMFILMFGKGTVASQTNYERLQMGWVAGTSNYKIWTLAGGTGTVRPLQIETGSNANQLTLNIDGSNSMSGALSVTGITNTSSYFSVDGTQVVTNQQAAVADATGAGDVVAQLNSLLAKLRTHGLIAT